jgi:hypothetical protein
MIAHDDGDDVGVGHGSDQSARAPATAEADIVHGVAGLADGRRGGWRRSTLGFKTYIGLGAVAALALGVSTAAHAAEVVVETSPIPTRVCYPEGWPALWRGQSFTAPVSGSLTQVGFYTFGGARTTTVSVSKGVGAAREQITTQAIEFPASAGMLLTSITLTDPVAVEAGEIYAVEVADSSCGPFDEEVPTFWMHHGVDFDGGTALNHEHEPLESVDLAFRFVVDEAAPPTIEGSRSPTANVNGWNNTDVTVTFSCADQLAGVTSCSPPTAVGEGEGQSVTGTVVALDGRTAHTTVSDINVDKTAPDVALVAGPMDGATYLVGQVPSPPTCTATDDLSQLDGGCAVTGYSAAVGQHTVTASATDRAGNTGSTTAHYTVGGWTLTGFFSPVDMDHVVNVVKGGSTVPMKFELFAGPTEITDPSAVMSFTQTKVSCSALDLSLTDPIEVTTTGGTSLRYDTSEGQFIQSWKTPKVAGSCYKVSMTTQDGSALEALFQLK